MINRRGFLKSLALAMAGLLGWRLPILRPEPPIPISRHGGWFHAVAAFAKDVDRRAFLDGKEASPDDDLDCITDLQIKMGRAARLSFEKGIRGRGYKGWEKGRRYDVTVTTTFGTPPSGPHVGKIEDVQICSRCWTPEMIYDAYADRWDLGQLPVNDGHPLAKGLVGIALPTRRGGLAWWHRRTDGSEWERERIGG